MGLAFEWDGRKAGLNHKKHGVSFEEAATVFGDPLSLTIDDPHHSSAEERSVTIGESTQGRLLVVAHADRGDTIRIIGSRLAIPLERRAREVGNEAPA